MTRRAPLAADRLEDRLAPAWGLDPTFGTDGTAVLSPVPAGASFVAAASLPLADGNLLVAGTLTSGGGAGELAVLRLKPDGAPDPTFNGGQALAVPGTTVLDPKSVRLAAAGGKVLLAADTPAAAGTGTDVLVVRLNANGAVDAQFGINGGRVLAADLDGTPSQVADLRALPDGRVAVLSRVAGDVAVTVLNSGGAVDPSFAGTGTARLNLGTAPSADGAAALGVQTSAGGYRLIVAGDGGGVIAAVRLSSAGELDTRFGAGGRATVGLANPSNRDLSTADVAVDDGGRVVLLGRDAGRTAGIPGTAVPSQVLVARLTADGRLDPSFGTDGRTTFAFSNAAGQAITENTPVELTALPGGSLLVLGAARTAEIRSGDVFAANDFAVARLTAGGQADDGFGPNGQVLVRFDDGTAVANDVARTAAVLANGDLILVGTSADPLGAGSTGLAVARLTEQAVSPPTTPPPVPPVSPPTSPPPTSPPPTSPPPTSPPPTSPPPTSPPASPPVVIRPPTFVPAAGERAFAEYPADLTRMTAAGDVTGDGIADYLYSTGSGMSRIKLVDGATGQVALGEFNPYETGFRGGVFIALGDLDGDGRSEIVVSPDIGGSARVQVYKWTDSGLQRVANFFAIDDPNYRGGATVAVGDVNGDGKADLIVGAANGGGPRVAVFDGAAAMTGKVARLTNDFFGLPDTNFRGGVSVAAGDFDGDGKADIVIGAGPGGGSRVRVLNAVAVLAGTPDDGVLRDFLVRNNGTNRTGVTLSTMSGEDGILSLVTADGSGQVIYAGATGDGMVVPKPIRRR